MLYRFWKVNEILPKNKEQYNNFEEFAKEVYKLSENKPVKELDEEILVLFKALYTELSSDEYNYIRAHRKIDYSIYKDNSAFLTKVLTESEDKYKDYIDALNIIGIKYSVLGKITSDVYDRYVLPSAAIDATSDTTIIKEYMSKFRADFRKRTRKYRNNPIFKSYFEMYKINEVIESEIINSVSSRARSKEIKIGANKDNVHKSYVHNRYGTESQVKRWH